LQGNDNSFAGPVPIERVRELLATYAAEDVPVTYADTGTIIPGVKAIRRIDNGAHYKIFSDGYQQHDYSQWLVDKVGDILDQVPGDLVIANAGGLANGAVAFVQIEAPESFKAAMGVEFRPNFTAVTSLNGRFATTYKWMITNAVCDNTVAAGMSEKSLQAKFKHTSKSLGNIRQLRADLALTFINEMADEFAAQVDMLGAIPVDDTQWSKFLDLAVKIDPENKGRARTLAEHKRADLTQLWNSDPMVAPWKGNAWGVVQAVNTYDQWTSIVRGKEREERNMYNALAGKMFALDATTIAQITAVTA
jgi:phage/plasmid-like protein (TIGR03299 family)